MASGRMYNSDDMVEEYLINQIAKYVQYDKLGRLSGDLGIKSNDYQKITAPNTFNQEDQICKVLNIWYQALPLEFTVRDFVTEVRKWLQEGYLDLKVWNHMTKFISAEALKGKSHGTEELPRGIQSQTETLKDKSISDNSLGQLASKISPQNLASLAINEMGFNQNELDTLNDECRDDKMKFRRQILIKWRNKNSRDPNIRSKFAYVLDSAVKAGWMNDADVKEFWMLS